jgi:hypothetical protein
VLGPEGMDGRLLGFQEPRPGLPRLVGGDAGRRFGVGNVTINSSVTAVSMMPRLPNANIYCGAPPGSLRGYICCGSRT